MSPFTSVVIIAIFSLILCFLTMFAPFLMCIFLLFTFLWIALWGICFPPFLNVFSLFGTHRLAYRPVRHSFTVIFGIVTYVPPFACMK